MKIFFTIAALLMLFPYMLTAQYTISGKLSDNSNAGALSGAGITIENTYQAFTSDAGGYFSTGKLKAGNYTLRFSFIGYSPEVLQLKLSADTIINIALKKSPVMQDEVIISATRASDNDPATQTTIKKQDIIPYNTGRDIPYLLQSAPSVVVSSDAGNGVGYTGIRIRGSDITRINVTINGIPYNDPESQGVFWVNIPDMASSVDNIQIQRGIGTSVNGSAAFGASINIQTTRLNPEPYAEYSGGYGSFDTWKNTVMGGTGLIAGHWAFDARLSKITSNGYIERAKSDLKSFYISGGYYGKNTLLKLIVFSGKEKTYQAWQGVPKDSLKTNRRYNPFTYSNQTDNYQQDNYQLLFSQQAGKYLVASAALHYTYGRGYYEEYESENFYSAYGLPDQIIGPDTLDLTDLVRQKWLNNHFYGFTFSLNYNNKKNTEVILGGSGNQYSDDHYGDIIWLQYAGNIGTDYQWHKYNTTKNDFNIYIRANYSPVNKVSIYADLQYRYVDIALKGLDSRLRDVSQSHTYHFFNPKAGINVKLDKNHKLYLALALAHREPNGNNFADANPQRPAPIPETMYNAELGYAFTKKNITASANVYGMYYQNQLVLTGEINDVGYAIMTNVPESYRAGVELGAAARFWKRFTWEVNAGLSINRILDFTEYIDDWDNGGQIMNHIGNTGIAFSPDITANNIFKLYIIKNLNFSLISRYVGRQYIDNTSNRDRSLDPYCVSDALLEYKISAGPFREIGISVAVNNIFNAMYENNAWVYRYYFNGEYQRMDGYFPQAGIHFMSNLSLKF